ncbi:MAG: hypothetical protein ACRBN8_33040 [Nannocystales bacterium]
MALPPIKLSLDGEEIHLVAARELDRWGGYLHARGAAYALVTPENISRIRHALMCSPSVDTEGVFVELRKQLEDGGALFFEVPPAEVPFEATEAIDIFKLIPKGGNDDEDRRPGPNPGLHWIEVICVSAKGESFAGARARIRLPGGRSEFVTLDARSSVRFDDLTDDGTAHFELSGDAVARGTLDIPTGTRYEIGSAIGLPTRRQHVLIVHPQPGAFVSVELFVEEEPVLSGQYTLTTKNGDTAGALEGELVRDDGFPIPSAASFSFEQVLPPPRTEDAQERDEDADADSQTPVEPVPTGTDPSTQDPLEGPVPEDSIRVTLQLDDGTPVPGTIELSHARTETQDGDQAEFSGVEGEATVAIRGLRLPS